MVCQYASLPATILHKSVKSQIKGNSFELQGILQHFLLPACVIIIITKQNCHAHSTFWPETICCFVLVSGI